MLDEVRAGNPLTEALIRLPIARQCQQTPSSKHKAEDVVHEALHAGSPPLFPPFLFARRPSVVQQKLVASLS
jgi:hypothetical protein